MLSFIKKKSTTKNTYLKVKIVRTGHFIVNLAMSKDIKTRGSGAEQLIDKKLNILSFYTNKKFVKSNNSASGFIIFFNNINSPVS